MTEAAIFALQQSAVFILGCCLGSFFNVVIHRLPRRQSIVQPGSHCPQCGQPIRFYHNIPLLSYLLLRGRSSCCGKPISLRYPLVEGLTGILGLLLFQRFGWHIQFAIESCFVSLLIVIAFIDLDTYLIPDVLSLFGIVIGLGCSLVGPHLSWLESLLGIILGGGFFYLIAVGYQYFRHQEGLGGGDIKLLAMIGAFTGWMGALFAVLAASVVGTVIGLIVMYRSRKGLTTMLPFGPFLALGAVSYVFWGQAFYLWYLNRFAGY